MTESGVLPGSVPSHFKLCYSQDAIRSRVAEMGKEVSAWAADVWAASHTDVLVIPVLRGGIFFFADLVRAVSHSVEISPMRASSYDVSTNTQSAAGVTVLEDSAVPVRGRSVLLVDDICDSGRTFEKLTEYLAGHGALEVRTAVLLKRIVETKTFDPDWVGFSYSGLEWFVGYGMDDGERWRNLPSIYVIQQSA